MKKLIALVLALALVLAVAAASAVTITVTRDGTYDSEAAGNREFTYYQVFRATMDGTHTDSTTGDHGYDSNGVGQTPLTASGTASGFSYYLLTSSDSAQIAKMKSADNKWFTVEDSADGTRVNITWKNGVEQTHTNIQAAAVWLKGNCVLAQGNLTWDGDGKKWTSGATDLDAGYYVIESSEGSNLVAATSDINIKEKNSYPSVNKKQKKANGSWVDETRLPIEVGKTIEYQITVPVPADANKPLAIVDKMTAGLTYDDNLVVKIDGTGDAFTTYTAMTASDSEYSDDASVAFQIKFTADTVKTSLAGHTLYLTYSAKVNANAITDTGRENEVTIKYDNTHYSVSDKEGFDLYTTGAVKYDGATADVDSNNALVKKGTADIAYLNGAEFKLQVKIGGAGDWADLAVVKNTTDNTYRPAVSGETGVALVSDSNGAIIIRGLDNANAYQLVETKAPEGGYNLLSTTAPLNVTTKDSKAKVGLKGSAEDTTYLDNATTELSAKIANNRGTELPSTGGIGTTIFYILGGLLVIGAAVILVARRKAQD